MENKRVKKFGNMSDFFSYIKAPMKEEEIKQLYLINGIKKELLDLINDFVYSLTNNIYDTYLGNEYIKTKEDIENHFSWCYNQVIESYKKENFDFSKTIEIKEYFFKFFIGSFYRQFEILDTKSGELENLIDRNWQINHWNTILKYDNFKKSESDLDMLLDVYGLFENSLKNHPNS